MSGQRLRLRRRCTHLGWGVRGGTAVHGAVARRLVEGRLQPHLPAEEHRTGLGLPRGPPSPVSLRPQQMVPRRGWGSELAGHPLASPGCRHPTPTPHPPWRLPPGTATSHLSSGHLWLDVHHLHALLGVALLAHGAAQPARLLPAPRRRTRCCLCHGTGSIAGGGRGWGRRLPGSRAVRLTGVPCRGRGFLRRWWHGVGGPGNRLR